MIKSLTKRSLKEVAIELNKEINNYNNLEVLFVEHNGGDYNVLYKTFKNERVILQ